MSIMGKSNSGNGGMTRNGVVKGEWDWKERREKQMEEQRKKVEKLLEGILAESPPPIMYYADGLLDGILLNEYMMIKCAESEEGTEPGLQGDILDELGEIRNTGYLSEKITKAMEDWYRGILEECRENPEKIAAFSPCFRHLLKQDL